MSTPQKTTKSTITITHLSMVGDRTSMQVDATILSARIAVHQGRNRDGSATGAWNVSDPVSGFAYTDTHTSEAKALAFAKRLHRRFGGNPLRGAVIGPDATFQRKPVGHDKVKTFIRAEMSQES